MRMGLSKQFRFEASHLLPKHPGKCSRLHGHSWVLTVWVDGEVNEQTGMVMDYADLKAVVQPLIDRLDHRHLGAWCVYNSQRPGWEDKKDLELVAEIWGVEGPYFQDWMVPGLPLTFNPTSENLIRWIAGELEGKLRWGKLELNETCTSACTLTREDWNAGKDRS